MNKLRGYLVTGLASAAAAIGGSVGYDHFAGKAAAGTRECTTEYITQPTLLERCDSEVPFSGGRLGMEILGFVGVAGFAGSVALSLNTIRKSES